MIPETTRDSLLQAIERFDRELRGKPDWLSWPEQAGSHRWAISHNGQLYPVKQIISMATGQSASNFSRGEEANSYVTRYGFTVVPLLADGERSDPLARYASAFADLRSQTGETWWPATTHHRSP